MKSRKINKAKRVSNGCKNHGSCDHCQGSRTHSNRRRAPADEREQLREVELYGGRCDGCQFWDDGACVVRMCTTNADDGCINFEGVTS